MPQRLAYEESCRVLKTEGVIEAREIPPVPAKSPRYDDEEPGISFFRTLLADVKLDHLTLPRTFFGRSEVRKTSFRDTDLSESTANWNDFIDVDFGGADLSRADFRGCVFERVLFTDARLAKADFRHCRFRECDFAGADLADTKIGRMVGGTLGLSPEQERRIDWQTSEGEEPEGG